MNLSFYTDTFYTDTDKMSQCFCSVTLFSGFVLMVCDNKHIDKTDSESNRMMNDSVDMVIHLSVYGLNSLT